MKNQLCTTLSASAHYKVAQTCLHHPSLQCLQFEITQADQWNLSHDSMQPVVRHFRHHIHQSNQGCCTILHTKLYKLWAASALLDVKLINVNHWHS
jgi:hypothetical protein